MSRTTAFAALLVAFAARATFADEAKRPPNIVFILADDVGMECLGCYGGTSYHTPNLDTLAREGMQFNYCFSCPECCPSRAQLMTGRYGFRTGITHNRELGNFLDPERETTVAKLLQSAGYETGLSGKWHLADWNKFPKVAERQGFDRYSFWVHGEPRYWSPTIFQDGVLRTDVKGQFGPDVWNDYAIEFLRRNQPRPFFLYVPMVLVHEMLEDPPGTFTGSPGSDRHRVHSRRRFAENIEYMDKLVGELVAELNRLGMSEDTVILFSGDNGTASAHKSILDGHPIQGGKGTMNDTSSRVPLLVSWKGTIKPGSVCDDLVDFTDFCPTFLELAGATTAPPKKLDGVSFEPQLRGEPGHPREWVYVQLADDWYVRDKHWKLDDNGSLFDITNSPFAETRIPAAGMSDEAKAAKARLQNVLNHLR